MKAYCVKCKGMVEISNPVITEIKGSRGSRRAVKGSCPECGTKVCAFLKKE